MGLMDSLKEIRAAFKGTSTATLPSPPASPPPPPSERLQYLELDDEVAVVGTSNYQKALKEISSWTKREGPVDRFHEGVIEFEPTNPYDKNAIMVTVEGLLIGYVAKSDHRLMTPKVRKAGGVALVDVRVIGGTDGDYLGARLR